jgi:DNA-binding response OmpR family regulator
MLTAKDEVRDRVTGLNAGADDYVTKPFSMEELLARVKARLRRTQQNDPDKLPSENLILNGLTREVYRGSQLIELTAKEFDVLEFMLQNPRQIITRSRIFEKVWGYDFMVSQTLLKCIFVRYGLS